MKIILNWIGRNALILALIQAIVATLGSMYFSDVMLLKPCLLCWYQRIAMFPLVLSLATGIVLKDRNTHLFVLWPALIGWVIALYHNLLYYKFIPDTLAPCETGVSCTTRYFEILGFVTIPLMAFIAFSVIILLMIERKKYLAKNPQI
jgi:disulfide bond formation protein DsbB